MATTSKTRKIRISPEKLDQVEAATVNQWKVVSNAIKKGNNAKLDAVCAADLLSGVEVVDELDIDFCAIARSAENPRKSFDQTLISEMIPTIQTICALNPLTVRESINGTYELIDGETRHRAAELAGASTLRCKIVRCTDAQAAAIRILTSLQRRDLNPIERAAGIRALQQKHELTQRQLEHLLKMKQGSISNLTRLLDLPEELRAMVISGEITSAKARELCPWVDEPKVMSEVIDFLKKCEPELRNQEVEDTLTEVLRRVSKPISGAIWDSTRSVTRVIRLKVTDAQRELLRVKQVKFSKIGPIEERCFNLELWEELQAADEQKAARKASKRLDRESGQTVSTEIDPEVLAARAAQQAEQLNKRLYRYKISWLQARLIDRVKTFDEFDLMRCALLFSCLEGHYYRSKQLISFFELGRDFNNLTPSNVEKLFKVDVEPFWETAHELVYSWIAAPFDGLHAPLKPDLIEVLAPAYQIDFDDQWSVSCSAEHSTVFRELLDLLNKFQLAELVTEWDLPVNTIKSRRDDTIEAIDAIGKGKPVPKMFDRVKAVPL